MSEEKRNPLNLRPLREKALRSRAELAGELGLSPQLLVKLENGYGDTRLATVFQLCLVLSRHLDQPPGKIFSDLIPDEYYEGDCKVVLGCIHRQYYYAGGVGWHSAKTS